MLLYDREKHKAVTETGKEILHKLKNIWLALKDQLPFSRLIRNIRTGNVFGLFSKYSHYNKSGKPKVMYNTKATAQKAPSSMQKKNGVYYSNYKCVFCDGYHIGRNRTTIEESIKK